MFAIDEGLKSVNGVMVDTFEREIKEGRNTLEVEVGTTGYTGGCCREAGGRTYLRLRCREGDYCFKPINNSDGQCAGIVIACCGEDALDAIKKGIDFAKRVIDDQICDVDD